MAPVPEDLVSKLGSKNNKEIDEWTNQVEEVTSQIRGIIDGTITDFEAFDQQLALKERAKQIRQEELLQRKQRLLLYGNEGKGEGTKYKWWCKRCFVEYTIDLPEGQCTRCRQADQLMSQEARRQELMGKLEVFKEEKAKHKWRKDKWNRWKKSQALLGKSRFINYKAWEYWEPDTDSEEEGDPIVPRDNPEFLAMEADLKERKRKQSEKAITAEKCRQRGNQCMSEGDYVGAIENYDEGLEYRRDCKALWTNKALAELKVFRWHDAVASCNKVIEYAEIFEEGFAKSADACFKAFTRRATALRGLHRWEDAVNDLEDALSIYPKSKEALDLLEKTRQACLEAKKAQRSQESPEPPRPEETGTVRVEIEESDSEGETTLEAQESDSSSLQHLSRQHFANLLKDLELNETERSAFCTRQGDQSDTKKLKTDQWVGRKIDLKVEEVLQPSRLDTLLRDIERCSLLWKKRRPGDDGRRALEDDEPESQDADRFVKLVTPRALSLLLVLAKSSDHHCSLTVSALRHVWPLLNVEEWRYQILSLLFEWSQRSISAKSMAEFASRYPDPHVHMLINIVGANKKEDFLPPGFEDRAKKAADKLELGVEAMEEVMKGLTMESPMELAISTLGNLCLAGSTLSYFQLQISPLVPQIVEVLRPHLRPMDLRLCGKTAGALCNLLRLKPEEVERCTGQLLEALREEGKPEAREMIKAVQMTSGLGPATPQLLGALVNLAVARPTALVEMQHLGTLQVVIPLIDPEAYGSNSADKVISTRACLVSSRLLGAFPDGLSLDQEAELLFRLSQILTKVSIPEIQADVAQFSSVEKTPTLEAMDPPLRVLVTLLTKAPGALDRFVSGTSLKTGDCSISFSGLMGKVFEFIRVLQPASHVALDEESSTPSRLRGNLALLVSLLSDRQASENAAPSLRDLDLSMVVPVLVEMLRKERGSAQHNLGVSVTKLAQNPRYRDQVRELNGLESLHQIQLPKVNAQKEKEQRIHRLETSAEDRRRAIAMRRG
ncbi:unnamed protein product [Durusdinium trenchii]|uniref:Tetratricopeptide repeat protein 12 (TPR repeat protein 12) n=2 Tax=Durusdinium trenchii TaxID=1381693 RepID=A0ABP0KU15_9DINO